VAVSDGTLNLYANAFNLHILPAQIRLNPDEKDSELCTFGDLRLDEITRPRVKALVAYLLNKPRYRVVKVKATNEDGSVTITKKTVQCKLAKTTLRIILSALTTCLTNAQREDGLIPANPALGLGRFIAHAKKMRESIDPFRPEEVPVLLEAIRATAADFLCMFTILFHCGLRAGECAALTWGDVDFKNKYLFVRETWNVKGYAGKTKNRKERRVDLSDVAVASLKAHGARLQEEFLKKQAEPKEGEETAPKTFSDYVFPNAEGRPYNMNNVRNRIFNRACLKAGLHRRPLHATRHTFATLLLQQGESPVYVKEQMGHSSIIVTVDIYKHWIPSANRDAVNRLPSIGITMSQAAAGD
jgi:integrase